MILDGRKGNINKKNYSEITIVGAGTTGLFLAYLLRNKFKNITIIEKGNEISKVDRKQKKKIFIKKK